MKHSRVKANGIHYTPPELANFLVRVSLEHVGENGGGLDVLDPACGDGALLHAFAQLLPAPLLCETVLVGYETDATAFERAQSRLAGVGAKEVSIQQHDFLDVAGTSDGYFSRQMSLLHDNREPPQFDVVIANPPYVRTQVLGADRAQQLAKRFGLSGRVDLYHAFTRAMASVLRPGGTLGLLTSNRFLTVKSGAALRRLLRTEFNLEAIYDLGDTKLFPAAVLPVIVVARKCSPINGKMCRFERIYEHRAPVAAEALKQSAASPIDAIEHSHLQGLVSTPGGVYQVERGILTTRLDDEAWSLSTPRYESWLARVRQQQACSFDDVAKIRVGIKTTADEVFIRDDWPTLPPDMQPEAELLRPLIRHFDAVRWTWAGQAAQSVLYPHWAAEGKRMAIDLAAYPAAASYLESHRGRLSRRDYVIEGGRRWYEIWVPHHPADWKKPKIVFPDISEQPKFFLDETGAVVNGDCYWITLRDNVPREWLLVMLAIANSSFITRYYDIAFHNKLYAGRRRFMTQYVKKFPVVDPASRLGQEIVELTARFLGGGYSALREIELDELVWKSFGLVKEV